MCAVARPCGAGLRWWCHPRVSLVWCVLVTDGCLVTAPGVSLLPPSLPGTPVCVCIVCVCIVLCALTLCHSPPGGWRPASALALLGCFSSLGGGSKEGGSTHPGGQRWPWYTHQYAGTNRLLPGAASTTTPTAITFFLVWEPSPSRRLVGSSLCPASAHGPCSHTSTLAHGLLPGADSTTSNHHLLPGTGLAGSCHPNHPSPVPHAQSSDTGRLRGPGSPTRGCMQGRRGIQLAFWTTTRLAAGGLQTRPRFLSCVCARRIAVCVSATKPCRTVVREVGDHGAAQQLQAWTDSVRFQ